MTYSHGRFAAGDKTVGFRPKRKPPKIIKVQHVNV